MRRRSKRSKRKREKGFLGSTSLQEGIRVDTELEVVVEVEAALKRCSVKVVLRG